MKISKESILKDYNLLGLLEQKERSKYFDIIFEQPEALKYFDLKLQKRKIIKKFINQYHLFKYLNQKVLTKGEILLNLENHPENYEYLSKKRKQNIEYINATLKKDVMYIRLIPDNYMTKEIVRDSLNKNIKCLPHVKKEFVEKQDLLEYLKIEPKFFWEVCFYFKNFKDDYDILKVAVSYCGENLKHIDNQTIELCLLALENDPNCYEHIKIVEAKNGLEAKGILLEKQEILKLINGDS